MNKRVRTRLIVVTVAILALVGVLIYRSSRGGTLAYKTPTEIKAQQTAAGTMVRIAGDVATGTVVKSSEGVRFDVTDQKESIPVLYTGVVPDTFKEGVQVVIDGTYEGGAGVRSDSMVTKCPTKFSEELKTKEAEGQAAEAGKDGAAGGTP